MKRNRPEGFTEVSRYEFHYWLTQLAGSDIVYLVDRDEKLERCITWTATVGNSHYEVMQNFYATAEDEDEVCLIDWRQMCNLYERIGKAKQKRWMTDWAVKQFKRAGELD